MEFGLVYNTGVLGTDPQRLTTVARHAEDLGFTSFLTTEHVSLYPGARFGEVEFPADLPVADPLECLTFVAASTSSIRLGTAVLLLPFHHPIPLAKRLATIDVLSGGRMRLLTVGIGSLPGEAAAVGVDYATRGRRTDEAIDVLRALWAGDATGTSFHGEFFSFDDATSFPKPLQTLPIHVGGSSRAAARRAGRRGDGYFPGGWLSEAERQAQLDLVRSTAAAAGRDPDAIEYTRWGSLELVPSEVEGYAERGVDRLALGLPPTDLDTQLRDLETFAARHDLRR